MRSIFGSINHSADRIRIEYFYSFCQPLDEQFCFFAAEHGSERSDKSGRREGNDPKQQKRKPDRAGSDADLRAQCDLAAALDRLAERFDARFDRSDVVAVIVVAHETVTEP